MTTENIVKLNVGGTIFQTSKSTLTKYNGFFKTMLETGIPTIQDESGALFIDRSPKHFDPILNFMRDDHLDLPDSTEDVEEICMETQFYGLEELVQMCSTEIENRQVANASGSDRNLKFSTSFLKLNVGGTIFETSKSTLTKFDGFFKTMLETGSPIGKDASGAILVDRDPAHFRLILNYIRDGRLNLPESSEDVKEIQNEATYYLLDGLVELCEMELQKRVQKIVKIESEIKVLENDSEYLRVLAEPEKPVLIIYCSVGNCGRAIKPKKFYFKPFVSEYKEKLDIYFRPFNRDIGDLDSNPSNWIWSFHWREGFSYENPWHMWENDRWTKRPSDPFTTLLKSSIEKFFKDKNIPEN